MICFPLDNTNYEANALGAWCGTRTRGVFAADGHYAVTANDDMTITVSPGLAWLKAGQFWGVNAFESNSSVLTVDTADGSLSRIDAVCIRLDKNQNRAEIVVKKGSYSPQPPAITPPARNLDYDEIYVATIAVSAGATAIGQINITDQRLNEDYCGLMRDGVTGIPTQQLQTQWISWLAAFTDEAQTQFDAWFSSLADVLDDNAEANLINLINDKQQKSIISFHTVTPSDWTAYASAPFTHRALITLQGVSHRDIIEVAYNLASYAHAADCGCTLAYTADGRYELYAQEKPTQSLTYEYIIHKRGD